MKKLILTVLSVLTAVSLSAQIKKPTIMVIPSDLWCIQNGYYVEVNNQGSVERMPDYVKALQSDPNLLLVINKLGQLMANENFPLRDLETTLKRIKTEQEEDKFTTSSSGESISETMLDKLKRVARADIWMQITWTTNRVGPKASITYNLQGKDAYTDKQIAASSGISALEFASTIELPVLLSETVQNTMPEFIDQLMNHFQQMMTNGREITLTCRCWEDADYDFESEFDGEELSFIIENWISDNTVKGSFSTGNATESRLDFEQVRIPLYDANDRALDARRWANGLCKELRDKYGIASKLTMRGLGEAIIIIGGK